MSFRIAPAEGKKPGDPLPQEGKLPGDPKQNQVPVQIWQPPAPPVRVPVGLRERVAPLPPQPTKAPVPAPQPPPPVPNRGPRVPVGRGHGSKHG